MKTYPTILMLLVYAAGIFCGASVGRTNWPGSVPINQDAPSSPGSPPSPALAAAGLQGKPQGAYSPCGKPAALLDPNAEVPPDLDTQHGRLSQCDLPRSHRRPAALLDFSDFLAAVAQVESGGNPLAVGDGGASRGTYQISRAYWADACGYRGVDIDYDAWVTDDLTCVRVMCWYFLRYCRDALINDDFQTMARIHNGGPRGLEKPETLEYWRKVNRRLTGGAPVNGLPPWNDAKGF